MLHHLIQKQASKRGGQHYKSVLRKTSILDFTILKSGQKKRFDDNPTRTVSSDKSLIF